MVLAALLLAGLASTRTATAQTPDASPADRPRPRRRRRLRGLQPGPRRRPLQRRLGALQRKWADLPYSPARQRRVGDFLAGWADALAALSVARDDVEASIDHTLLSAEIRYRQELLAREGRLLDEVAPLLPFAGEIIEAARDPALGRGGQWRGDGLRTGGAGGGRGRGRRRAEVCGQPPGGLAWGAGGSRPRRRSPGSAPCGFLSPTDTGSTAGTATTPAMTRSSPGGRASRSRRRTARWGATCRRSGCGSSGGRRGGEEPIVGDPIGADGMAADLAREMMPYTPAELIALANEEFAWCEEEMLKASRELGFGEDWRAALEHVKTLHAEPGGQPQIVMMLAHEAIDFIEERGLVTVPPLAKEVWRLEMMSPRAGSG